MFIEIFIKMNLIRQMASKRESRKSDGSRPEAERLNGNCLKDCHQNGSGYLQCSTVQLSRKLNTLNILNTIMLSRNLYYFIYNQLLK